LLEQAKPPKGTNEVRPMARFDTANFGTNADVEKNDRV
jgi:hypothetical protein